MADTPRTNYDSLSGYSSGSEEITPTFSPEIARKQASIERAAKAKALLFGSPESQRVAATARIQGNDMGQTELMEDIAKFNPVAFKSKYGAENTAGVYNFNDAYRRVTDLKAATRTDGVAATDAAITTGQTLGTMALDVGAMAAYGLDQPKRWVGKGINAVLGTDFNFDGQLAPILSEWSGDLSEFAESNKSKILKERKEQHQIEKMLDATDAESQYRKDLANGMSKNLAYSKKFRTNMLDAATNYLDDPMMMGELGVQGAASLVPFVGIASKLGKAAALKQFVAEGMAAGATKEISLAAARKKLKTAAGKDLIRKESAAAIPMINAVFEGSGSFSQSQQEILGMSEEELYEVDAYKTLRENGWSHEQAQVDMASKAGAISAAIGAVTGYTTGKIVPAFEASPLRASGANTAKRVVAGARNILSETLEEGIQGGASQFGVNVGQTVAGRKVALDRDVAAGIGEGALAGAMVSGGAQAPGIALNATGQTLKLTGKGVAGGARLAGREIGRAAARKDATQTAKDNDASANERKTAGENIAEIVAESTIAAKTSSTQNDDGNIPVSGEKLIADELEAAITLPQEEAESLRKIRGDTLGVPDRVDYIDLLTKALETEKDANNRLNIASELLYQQSLLSRVNSSAVESTVKELGKDNAQSKRAASVRDAVKVFDSSPTLKEAVKLIESTTADSIAQTQGFQDIVSGKIDTQAAQESLKTLEMLSIYNVEAIPAQFAELSLEHSSSEGGNRSHQLMSITQDMVKIINALRDITETGDKIVEETSATSTEKTKNNWEQVRNQVLNTGNVNNSMPSLAEHTREVRNALLRKDVQGAQVALEYMRDFIKSQNNKIEAYNKSSKLDPKDNQVGFKAFGPMGPHDAKNPVYANKGSRRSVLNAKYVQAETESLVAFHNYLAKEVKEAGGKVEQIKAAQLNEDLQKAFPDDLPILRSVIETDIARKKKETKADPSVKQTKPKKVEAKKVEAKTAEAETTADLAEKAASETKAEAPVEKTEKPATLKETFPNLVKAINNGTQWLLEAFKLKAEDTGVLQHVSPAEWLVQNIEKLSGTDGPYGRDLSPEQIAWIKEEITVSLPSFAKAMNDLLQKKDIDSLENNEFALAYERLLSMNFLVKKEDGTYEFDKRVATAAFFAGMEWLTLEGNLKPGGKNRKAIAKTFGVREDEVTKEMYKVLRHGSESAAATQIIAKRFEALLGVIPNRNAPANIVQGLSNAMAGNVLALFEKHNKIDVYVTPSNGNKTVKTYKAIRTSQNAQMQKSIEPMKGLYDPFTLAFVPDAVKQRYVGTPPPKGLNQTVLRNKNNPLKPLARKAQEEMAQTPFNLNMPMFDLFNDLGDDHAYELLNVVELDEANMNVNDYETQHSRNDSVIQDLEGARGYLQEAREVDAGKGEVGKVPIFFPNVVVSTGRTMQQGPVTPQANKVTRNLIAATNAILDMRDPDVQKWFKLTVAQNVGIGVDKQSHETSLAEVDQLFENPRSLTPAMFLVEDYLKDPSILEDADNRQALVDAFRNAVDQNGKSIEITPNLIHAVVDMARLNIALEQGGKAYSAFETSLALEVDGVSDGPINASVHMSTGHFSVSQIMAMQQGGVSFDPANTTINEFLSNGNQDLYAAAAKVLTGLLQAKLKKLSHQSGNERKAFLAMLRVMDALLPGFSITGSDIKDDFQVIEDGKEGDPLDFEISRNVTKDPLMVYVYGSGVGGIAGKLLTGGSSEGMLTVLYKEFSNIMQGDKNNLFEQHPTLMQDLNNLIGFTVEKTYGKLVFERTIQGQQKLPTNARLLKDFTLSRKSVENMTNAIKLLIGDEIKSAVNIATGGLSENMETAQRAAKTQTILFQAHFNKLLREANEKRQKAHEAKWAKIKQSNPKRSIPKHPLSMSENEMMEVFLAAQEIAPIYETEGQDFHISGKERRAGSNAKAGSSLTGQYRIPLIEPTASDAGQRVSPYMVIGSGDGRMVMNIYANNDGTFDTSLQVYDGIELSIDKIEKGAPDVNKAVYDGWMQGNIFQALAEGYERLVPLLEKTDVFSELTKAQIKDLTRLNFGFPKEQPEISARSIIIPLRNTLRQMANESTARKKALARVKMWVDHMASAMVPYEAKGEMLKASDPETGPTPQEIVEQLNVFYEEELTKLDSAIASKEAAPATGSKPSKAFMDLLKKFGKTNLSQFEGLEDVDVVLVQGADIGKMLKATKNNDMSKEQRSVLYALTENHGFEDTTFMFGSAKDLAKAREVIYAESKYPGLNRNPLKLGRYYPGIKLGLIVNTSPETVLHELIHARVADLLSQYYTDPSQSPQHVKDAVGRLNILMENFSTMDFSHETPKTKAAAEGLQSILNNPKNSTEEKMHEFLAYSLTQQTLIETGKRIRVFSPLVKLVRKALHELKEMLGLKKLQFPANDLFTQVRFNMQIAIAPAPHAKTVAQETQTRKIFNQLFGPNESLDALEVKLLNNLQLRLAAADTNNAPTQKLEQKRDALLNEATAAVNEVTSAGFTLNAREIEIFRAMHATLQSGLSLDPAALKKAQEIHIQALEKLTEKDFLDDPKTATFNEKQAAKKKVQQLSNMSNLRINASGKSDLLATFFALSLVNPEMQKALASMALPKAAENSEGGINGWISTVGNLAINKIVNLSLRDSKIGQDAATQIASLAEVLSEVESKRHWAAAEALGANVDAGNALIKGKLAEYAEKAVKKAGEARDKASNPVAKKSLTALQIISALGSEKETKAYSLSLIKMLNKSNHPLLDPIRALVRDFVGDNQFSKDSARLVNKSKQTIDRLRTSFQTAIPKILKEEFTKDVLSKSKIAHLFTGLTRTDLLAIGEHETMRLLADPQTVHTKIAQEEKTLSDLVGSANANKFKLKAKALAHFMVHRENISNAGLLRNTNAITDLTLTAIPDNRAGVHAAIDRLTSLYAFEKTSPETKEVMKTLVADENNGMKLLVGYAQSAKSMEEQKLGATPEETFGYYNGWKGYVPSVVHSNASLRIADDSLRRDLEKMGYTRTADYTGDANERYSGTRGVYFSHVPQRNKYRSGVAQTVHNTFMGVDAKTGLTRSHEVSGAVLGGNARKITSHLHRNRQNLRDDLSPGEYLIPIFNPETKQVIGYERPISSEHMVGLNASEDIFTMLGAWTGRNVEESLARDINKELLQVLKAQYDDPVNDPEEFINLADPKQTDAVQKDIWETLDWTIKQDAADTFGEINFFPIRRIELDDMVGFRAAGITDAWTGISRLSPKVQKGIRDTANVLLGPLGKDAYKYTAMAQTTVTDFVRMAKEFILIKSVSVIVNNLQANVLDLASWGINPLTLPKQFKNKFVELSNYQKNFEKITKLNVLYAANFTDPVASRKYLAQIKILEDANKDLSISPLIDAYEFNTIAEGLTEDDLAIREGRLLARLDSILENKNIPSGVREAGKQLLITKETATYQALNRALQYGDFLAKAILYDHLRDKKKMEKQAALDIVAEQYVNYNKQSGRVREGLESHGLLWFYNYKLRITKIALRTMRDRPLLALFYLGGVGPIFEIDNVVESSLPGSIVSGDAAYSVGTEMGRNAWTLHPLFNLNN